MTQYQAKQSSLSFAEKTLLVISIGAASGAFATELDIADAPLFLDAGVQPNIYFVVDDSGSMDDPNVYGEGMKDHPDINIGQEYRNNTFDWTPSLRSSGQATREALGTCSGSNVLYYDPQKIYTPWAGVDSEGNEYADQDAGSALTSPYSKSAVDLAWQHRGAFDSSYYINFDLETLDTAGDPIGFFTWYDINNNGVFDYSGSVDGVLQGDLDNNGSIDAFLDQNNNGVFDGFVDQNGNGVYDPGPIEVGGETKYEFESELECPDNRLTADQLQTWFISVSEMSNTTQVDIGMGQNPLTKAQMRTNFANWFTYYRTRSFVMKKALSEIITASTSRMGIRALNSSSYNVDIKNMDDISTPRSSDAEANKKDLLKNMYQVKTSGGTPLRSALSRAGEYFDKAPDAGGPILPVDDGGTCQQNFSILLTDGYQNGGSASSGVTDDDHPDKLSIAASLYDIPNQASYSDNVLGTDDTLADIAMYYYHKDLQPDMADSVSPFTNVAKGIYDTNPRQHMVTYTVAFGVSGTLPLDVQPWEDGFDGWPVPEDLQQSSIDDVWHAAYNGRGLYLNASNPDELIDSLGASIQDIAQRNGSSSAVAVNSGSISSTSMLFQAEFNSSYWGGRINGIPIDSDGTLLTEDSVLASVVPEADDRIIATYSGGAGVPFQWDELSAAQKGTLGSESILEYLRGDSTNEGDEDSNYRKRDSQVLSAENPLAKGPLGDIINSAPVYVGNPEFLYPDTLESSSSPYSAFRLDPDGDSTSKVVGDKTLYRDPVLYVGSNDGFLHAFDVDPEDVESSSFGKELFAYVPSMVMNRLPELASQYYEHDYTVDGSPTVADAFFDSAWHTVLVSGLNSGGQGIYALDITNPAGISDEDKLADAVLWEFSDADDADLGYTYSKPIITRLNYNGGTWVAIFGNGYNNTVDDGVKGSGTAVLYIVDLATGLLIKKIDTGKNDLSVTNGLSSPTALDIDGDFNTDYVYAGDLEGNVWKFDVSSTSVSDWDVVYGNSSNKKPLYTACYGESCSTSNRQPITSQVKVGINRGATGHIVYFGTGQYITTADNSSTSEQSFYGIWDRHLNNSTFESFNRFHLLEQSILEEFVTTEPITEQRLTSRNLIDWHSNTAALPVDGTDDDDLTDTHLGWYLDLYNTDTNEKLGERFVTDISLRDEEVIFNTSIPNRDACGSGGTGWFMVLDATSGAGPESPVIDVNLDGIYDSSDIVLFEDGSTPAPSSGTRTPALATGCVFITLTDGSQVCLANMSDATVSTVGLNAGAALGRWMWRELRD